MSIKEELIEKIQYSNTTERKNGEELDHDNDHKEHKRAFRNLKRKYRLLLIFVIGFLLILILMILPTIIAVFSQGL